MLCARRSFVAIRDWRWRVEQRLCQCDSSAKFIDSQPFAAIEAGLGFCCIGQIALIPAPD